MPYVIFLREMANKERIEEQAARDLQEQAVPGFSALIAAPAQLYRRANGGNGNSVVIHEQ